MGVMWPMVPEPREVARCDRHDVRVRGAALGCQGHSGGEARINGAYPVPVQRMSGNNS